MVIFGVLTSWVGQRTPKTIDHRWSMLLHTFKSPATDQHWLFAACRIFFSFLFFSFFFFSFFFFNLIKLYQEFLQRAIRFRPISNSKIPHIWCIVGMKRGKINALWDTFYHLLNPIMHNIYSTMYKMWYSLLQYWASYYESTVINCTPKLW